MDSASHHLAVSVTSAPEALRTLAGIEAKVLAPKNMTKNKILAAMTMVFLALSAQRGLASDTNTVATEIKDLDRRILVKYKDHKTTEADLAGELKEFDALMDEHKGGTPDDLVQILEFKAAVYKLVLHEPDQYDIIIGQIERDYPDSKEAKQKKHQDEIKKLQAAFDVGKPFPDFDETDVAGKPVSLANYKGKVVLIDFWATWCGPCKGELPNVQKVYGKYHDQGFEIVGVSLDSDKGKLESFTSQHNMPWQQFFDGQGWKNKLAVKYGIESIPATFLVDGDGKVIGRGLRGEALETAVSAALAKK